MLHSQALAGVLDILYPICLTLYSTNMICSLDYRAYNIESDSVQKIFVVSRLYGVSRSIFSDANRPIYLDSLHVPVYTVHIVDGIGSMHGTETGEKESPILNILSGNYFM
jgi:hypothetical protein